MPCPGDTLSTTAAAGSPSNPLRACLNAPRTEGGSGRCGSAGSLAMGHEGRVAGEVPWEVHMELVHRLLGGQRGRGGGPAGRPPGRVGLKVGWGMSPPPPNLQIRGGSFRQNPKPILVAGLRQQPPPFHLSQYEVTDMRPGASGSQGPDKPQPLMVPDNRRCLRQCPEVRVGGPLTRGRRGD